MAGRSTAETYAYVDAGFGRIPTECHVSCSRRRGTLSSHLYDDTDNAEMLPSAGVCARRSLRVQTLPPSLRTFCAHPVILIAVCKSFRIPDSHTSCYSPVEMNT